MWFRLRRTIEKINASSLREDKTVLIAYPPLKIRDLEGIARRNSECFRVIHSSKLIPEYCR